MNFHWQPIKFMHARSGQYCDMPNTQITGKEVRLAAKRSRPHALNFECYINGLRQPCNHPTMDEAKIHCQVMWIQIYGNYIPNFHDNRMNERNKSDKA